MHKNRFLEMSAKEYFSAERRNAVRPWWDREDSFGDPVWVLYATIVGFFALCALGAYYNLVLH